MRTSLLYSAVNNNIRALSVSTTAFKEFPARSGAVMLFLLLLQCLAATYVLAAPENFVYGRPKLFISEANKLTLSLPLSVDNEDALGDILRDGASLELSIKIVVQRKRSLWFNAVEQEIEYTSLLRHDPLSRAFRMTVPDSEQILQDKNLRALLARTWKSLNLTVASAELFNQKNNYLIKVNISLKHAALPPWLDRTLVFWTKEVVNSTSFELDY